MGTMLFVYLLASILLAVMALRSTINFGAINRPIVGLFAQLSVAYGYCYAVANPTPVRMDIEAHPQDRRYRRVQRNGRKVVELDPSPLPMVYSVSAASGGSRGMDIVKNFIRVPVITPKGELLTEVVYRNTVFPWFHPEKQEPDLTKPCSSYPLVIVQWGLGKDGSMVDVTSSDLEAEVKFQDKVYIANRYGGTNVKEQRTLGVRYDIVPWFDRHIKFAEQATKVSRATLPQGMQAWEIENLRVLYVEDGKQIGNLVVDDGIAYIADDLVANYSGPKSEYRWGRQNAQVWQDLKPTPSLIAAFKKRVKDYFSVTPTKREVFYEELEKTSLYQELADLNPLMEQHPFVQRKVAGKHAAWKKERLQSLPLQMRIGIAVPMPRHIPYISRDLKTGTFIQHRYPKTAPVGTTVHEVKEITPEMRFWWEWWNQREGFQSTLSNIRESHKNVTIAVPRSELPEGVDFVTSASNVKLGDKRMGTIARNIKVHGQYEYTMDVSTMIVVTQWYKRGSFAMVNMTKYDADGNLVSWGWPAKAGDVDGDIVFEAMVDDPRIAKAFNDSQIPEVLSLKVTKTKHKVERTVSMFTNAFMGGRILGQWTNLRAWYLALPASSQAIAQRKMYEAHLFEDPDLPEGSKRLLNESSHRAVIMYFALRIQEAVDSPKSLYADMWQSRKEAGQVQAILSTCGINNESLKSPGWIHWKRSSGAGSRWLPGFVSDLPDWMVYRASIDRDWRSKEQRWIDTTPDLMRDSTIGTLLDICGPYVQKVWDNSVELKETLGLSEYVHWGGVLPQETVDKAQDLFFPRWTEYLRHNQRDQALGFYDPSDVEDVHKRHANWRALCQQLVDSDFGGDRWLAARALWIAAHNNYRGDATGAIVFVGFPEECFKIVSRSERVHAYGSRTLAIGLHHHFAGTPPTEFVARVEVVGRDDSQGRRAFVALTSVQNLKKGGNDGFPPFTIGAVQRMERPHVKAGYSVPDLGVYDAEFRLVEGTRSWSVSLEAIEQ
jgi:hypothetical protein